MTQERTQELLEEAEGLLDNGEYPKAEELAVEVLSSQKSRNEAWAYCILGACSEKTGNFEKAFLHYDHAFKDAEIAGNSAMQARALNDKALAHMNRSEYDVAST